MKEKERGREVGGVGRPRAHGFLEASMKRHSLEHCLVFSQGRKERKKEEAVGRSE